NRRVDNEEGHMVMVQLLITFRSSNQHDTHNDVRKDSVTLCDTPFSVWKHAGCLVDREGSIYSLHLIHELQAEMFAGSTWLNLRLYQLMVSPPECAQCGALAGSVR
ncbi:hypothetical protein KUCAC02_028809, partial [Chaenocephalus aceratus]